MRKRLLTIYDRLYKEFGPRGWWPADTPFEVIVGAILTQNTAWSNVEKAIRNLKAERLLDPSSLAAVRRDRLARLIRPAGYYNVKAKRLKNFTGILSREFGNDLKRLLGLPAGRLRKRLLDINGIGPETADSILLYAANRPIFVVDAYTKRILSRHKIIGDDATYDQIQSLLMKNLPNRARLFNEYHALFVQLGKEYCRKKPLCRVCPLNIV
ncbi:endonuclease III domain-containing protein [Omnitrophica bacterium]|nr:endonuclease III domain-containing protein [Candidatus Omnitrophota bacterium]